MRTTRVRGRQVGLALALTTAAALAGVDAAACEAEYRIRSGDTLGRIAAECDTSVAALERANSDVDPRALRLGQVLTIPEADGPVVRESSRTRPASMDPPEDAAGYEVRSGDTLASIAATLGISVETLMAANEGIDPHAMQIGQRLNVPDSDEVEAILAEREAERRRLQRMAEEYPDPELRLGKGEWRLTVDVEADGLAPGEPVEVAVSGDGEDWITLGEMPADREGYLFARARIPAELVDRETLHFALERPSGDRLSAEYMDGAGGTAQVAQAADELGGTVEVAGKVVRGGDCALLVTRQGETYALKGQGLGATPGSQVLVSGATGGEDGCVGHTALEVHSLTPLPKG